MSLPPFQDLVDQHGPTIHRFLVARVGAMAADDCWQETMLSALRAYPDLREDSHLRAWLFTIAANKTIDHHRRRGRGGAPTADPPDVPASDGGRDPGLWSAVAALPSKQAASVLLRYAADLPYRDIGVVVGCSEAAARQNVRAGLIRLGEVLG